MKVRCASLVLALVLVAVLPAAPSSAARPHRIVWVALEGAGQIAKADVSSGVLRRIDTRGGGPHNITVTPDGTIVAALWASDRIVIFRDGDRTFVRLGGAPHDVKIARNMIVVANQGSERIQLVKLDGTLLRRIELKADPHDLAVDPAQRHVWVSLEGSDDLAVVDLLHEKRRVRYVSTGERPHDLLFAPDGRLWVTDWDGALHVYRGRRARQVRSIPLGDEAHHLAFTPDGRFAWITDHAASAVFVVRTQDVRVVERIGFPGEPHHVTILPGGRRAIVADHENGRLVVYDTATARRVKFIRVGSGPHGVWAVPSPPA